MVGCVTEAETALAASDCVRAEAAAGQAEQLGTPDDLERAQIAFIPALFRERGGRDRGRARPVATSSNAIPIRSTGIERGNVSAHSNRRPQTRTDDATLHESINITHAEHSRGHL